MNRKKRMDYYYINHLEKLFSIEVNFSLKAHLAMWEIFLAITTWGDDAKNIQ
jgi:hypothetical protein